MRALESAPKENVQSANSVIKPKGCDSLDVSTFKKLFIQEAEKEKEKDRKGESEREIAVETEKD